MRPKSSTRMTSRFSAVNMAIGTPLERPEPWQEEGHGRAEDVDDGLGVHDGGAVVVGVLHARAPRDGHLDVLPQERRTVHDCRS